MDEDARRELDRLLSELAGEREFVHAAEELRRPRARLERVQGRPPSGAIDEELDRAQANIRRIEARIAEIEGQLRGG